MNVSHKLNLDVLIDLNLTFFNNLENELFMSKKILVIGAGLAGCEVSWFLANKGMQIILCEGKSLGLNPAQKIPTFAELVCTNSLKSKVPDSAHGMLKTEMNFLGSLVLKAAEETSVPAGDALAVDREHFSNLMTKILKEHPNVTFIEENVADPLKKKNELGADYVVVATGPLTTGGLTKWIQSDLSDADDFYFYDAIAPVVDADSLDYSKLYYKERHKPVGEIPEETADYLNAPMNQEEYERFIYELVNAEKVPPKNFEEYKFFESCLPIDTMAERGPETARFSCMKPIGLEMPDGNIPYACVQLRKENLLGSAFNMVGFQTRLTYKEQLRIFRMIPGFSEANFIHLGSVHRNSFLNARKLLNFDMSSKKFPEVYFAGQITGVEGYTESSAIGLYVGYQLFKKISEKEVLPFPVETAIGSLINYILTVPKPVPSNINVGLMPPVTLTKEERRRRHEIKRIKKAKIAVRAKESIENFLKDNL
jgi:methylenetetrahydrofolate--tRNA-(uracil-5-)-methyltransferase